MSIEITNILVDVWFQRLDSAVAEKRILIIAEAYADARVRVAKGTQLVAGADLRDYFAAKTMQAIYTRLGGSPSAGSDHDGTLTHIAEGAYQMADAMLAQREK